MSPRERKRAGKLRFRTEIEGKNGWTRWVNPRPDRYVMKCCDCGLAHILQFKAFEHTPERKDGSYRMRLLPRSKYGVTFRARRSPKYSTRSAPQ